MKKKFELTKETKIIAGIKAYRIKALRSFNDVKKGDLGGFVQKESNLSHDGNCWIYDDAAQLQNAYRSENACSYNKAISYGNSQQYGNSEQFGNSKQFGDSRQFGNSKQFGDSQQYGKSSQYGKSRQYGKSNQYGNSIQEVYSQQYGNSYQYGKSLQYGDSRQFGNSRQFGDSIQSGNSIMCEDQIMEHGNITVDYTKLSKIKQKEYHLYTQLGVILDEGVHSIILYKKVNKTNDPKIFEACFDHKFIYKVGEIAKVTKFIKGAKSCAAGLHFSTLNHWMQGNALLKCEIALKDIITIQQGKVRASKCKVLSEVKLEF